MNNEALNMLRVIDRAAAKRRYKILCSESEYEATGTVYYVSENGNDKNDGMSPQSAFRTLAHISDYHLLPGDTVLFARGETFRGKLICQEGVAYSAYGSGPKPSIFASPENAAFEELWEKLPGTENIYRYAKKLPDCGTAVFDGGTAHSVKEIPSYINGAYFVRGTDIPFEPSKHIKNDLGIFCDCTAVLKKLENGAYVPDMYNENNLGTLYMRCDRGNPGRLFGSIELSVRRNAVVPKNNVTLDNLCIKYAGCHGVGGGNTDGLTVRSCEIGWIGGGIQLYNNDGSVTRFGNGVEIYVSCSNYTVEHCFIYQVYDAAVTHQFKGKNNSVCNMQNVVYRRNLIENCVYSVEYFLDQDGADGVMSDILIEENIMRCAGYGFGAQRPDKSTPSHIKGWDHKNNAENFIIKNNIFDRSVRMLVHCGFADETSKPVFDGNVYIAQPGSELCRFGKNPTSLTKCEANASEVIRNIIGDKDAKVYIL